jgi:hypothetical protein
MTLVVGVVLVTFFQSSFACVVPIMGEKYDSQIEITKLDATTYQVSVPRYMEDLPNEAEVMLAYSATPGGIPIYEPYEILETEVRGERVVAEFQIERRAGSKPYIVVMWWPTEGGLCGIQANSGFIESE